MKEKSRREFVRSRSFQRINGLTQRTPVHKITTRFNAKKESIFILDSKSDKYHYTEWAQNGFERQDISHGVQRCPTLSHVVPRCPTLSHVVPRCPTLSHGVPRCPTASHGVPRRPTVSNGVPRCSPVWIIQNSFGGFWRSKPDWCVVLSLVSFCKD